MPSKKQAGKSAKKAASRKVMDADDHRKMAEMHHAKGSLHSAKAQLLEAQNPSKNKKTNMIGRY